MKKVIMKSVLASVAGIGLMASSAMAVSITYESQLASDNTLTTTRSNAVVWDFNSLSLGLLAGGTYENMFTVISPNDAAIVNGSSTIYAAPYNTTTSTADATNYLTVPRDTRTGNVTISLDSAMHYLGLFWGSIDDYNNITFHYTDGSSETFDGYDVTKPNVANGNRTAPSTNTYVNFSGLKAFNSFTLSSYNYAFEIDNIAVSPIPEPGVTLLFGLGVLGFLGVVRRRSVLSV